MNLILCVWLFKRRKKSENSFLVCVQNMSMSSIYLCHSRGRSTSPVKKSCSTSAITSVANAGANLVPIARPHVCLKKCPSKVNTLLCSTCLSKSRRNTKRGWCLKCRVNVLIALSCVMFVYRLSTSSVTRYVWGGNAVRSSMCNMSMELRTKEGTDLIKGWSNLSRYAEAVCVGPNVHETMGLIFNGVLCIFGKKYIVCVVVSVGSVSSL